MKDNEFQPFFCYQCKAARDYLLVDGYPVGDRLLEGVLFAVRPAASADPALDLVGDLLAVRVIDEHSRYFNDLNIAKWLREVLNFAESDGMGQCPTCNADADLFLP